MRVKVLRLSVSVATPPPVPCVRACVCLLLGWNMSQVNLILRGGSPPPQNTCPPDPWERERERGREMLKKWCHQYSNLIYHHRPAVLSAIEPTSCCRRQTDYTSDTQIESVGHMKKMSRGHGPVDKMMLKLLGNLCLYLLIFR